MAKLFVGQRVRLVRAISRPDRNGMTGRIRGYDPRHVTTIGTRPAFFVDWDDGERDGYMRDGFSGYVTIPDSIEPILPSGHSAGDFSFSVLMDKCREGEVIPA